MNRKIFIAIIMCAVLYGCTAVSKKILETSPEEIMEMYGSYAQVLSDKNKTGLSISFSEIFSTNDIVLSFSNKIINTDKEYGDAVLNRIFVANAEDLYEIFYIPPKIVTKTSSQTSHAPDGTITFSSETTEYIYHVSLDSIDTRYVVIGFKGISVSESDEFETLPLFFIVDKKEKTNLTPVPLQWEKPFSEEELEPRFFEHHAILKGRYLGDNEYTIKLGEIGNAENYNGYFYADFLSNEIKKEDFEEGNFYYYELEEYFSIYSPVFSEVVAGKKRYRCARYAILENNGHTVGVRHFYKTKDMPDTIIVYGTQKGVLYRAYFSDTVKFNGKTREVIKNRKLH